MSNEDSSFWSTENLGDVNFEEKVFEILRALGAEEAEVEVSQIYLPPIVELAGAGKVMPIDNSDPAGGFGGTDLLAAAVVPALAALFGLRRSGAHSTAAVERTTDEILRQVGSPRAKERRAELLRELGKVWPEHRRAG